MAPEDEDRLRTDAGIAEQRARLDAIECELNLLLAQYELAMSAFKFDEASALQHRIASREAERRALAAALPPPAPARESPPPGVVPLLLRPRRGSRPRR